MSNKLTNIDPFRGLARYEPFRNFETFFNDFRLRPMLHNVDVEPMIRMDVAETAEAYTVKAEIPGFLKATSRSVLTAIRSVFQLKSRKRKRKRKMKKWFTASAITASRCGAFRWPTTLTKARPWQITKMVCLN